MTDTETLIDRLSDDINLKTELRSPAYWGRRLVTVLTIYGVGVQAISGLRPDLFAQFTRPLFAAELLLLLALLLTSVLACVFSMSPDAYQKPRYLNAPYVVFGLFAVLVGVQLFLPPGIGAVIPPPGGHGVECTISIASIALIPSTLIFVLMRRGATVLQARAGTFAVLSASAVGCLTLRLAEANDSLPHLICWHYLPTVLFAAIGAYVGKLLLKW